MKKVTPVILLALLAPLTFYPRSATAQGLRSQLLAQGYELPKPWGLSVEYYWQKQPYKIDSLTLGIPGFDPALANGLKVDNRIETYQAVLDYWALPYLDLFALGGHIDGTTKVRLSSLNIGIPLQNIDVDYQGFFYGGGFTLAAGGKRYYGTLTTEYTNTSLNSESSSIDAWVVTPRFGVNLGHGSSVYVGAMYERPDEKHKGAYNVPFLGTVPYDVTLGSKNAWNYILGTNIEVTKSWELVLEGGFGKRHAALAHLGYRW